IEILRSKDLYKIGLLLLQVCIGLMMAIGHGYPKLISLIQGSQDFPDPIGLGPQTTLTLAVFSEFFCSIAVALGFRVRVTALFPMATMLIAAFVFHAQDPWG